MPLALARFRKKAPIPGAFLFWLAAFLLPVGPLYASARSENALVRHVVDGDTVVLADNRNVRLIGLNAPELGHDGRPDEPFAAAARDRLRGLVEGQRVALVFEAEDRDHYGRWLAHLRLGNGTDIEELLIKEGLASAVAIPPNVREAKRLFAVEQEARRIHRGIWGHFYSVPSAALLLGSRDTGYRFIRGEITHVGGSRKLVYLDIGPHFALRIARADWQQYFRGRPEDWRGVQVMARGWITEYEGRLHMGIGHPLMLERLP